MDDLGDDDDFFDSSSDEDTVPRGTKDFDSISLMVLVIDLIDFFLRLQDGELLSIGVIDK